jgi:uncharacterized protein (DUF924 family)
MNLPEGAAAILEFWFRPPGDPDREQHRKIWFKSTEAFDMALRQRFLADYELAAAGRLAAWEGSALAMLALVLLLDQVPRNIFRGTPRAYMTDAAARAVAERALEHGLDQQVPPVWRQFFYLPFHHSEDLADQRRARALFDSLSPDPNRGESRRYAHRYYDVIARFGRFPHRNAILGRESTAEEIAYLAQCEATSAARR